MSFRLLENGKRWLSLSTTVKRHASTTPRDAVFSNPGAADFLAAAASPSSIPALHGLPEIVVAGRANAGKSTLLNAIVGRRDLMLSSKTPGRTKGLNFFRVGAAPGKMVLVDAPGYGARGRPEWGSLFDHYLATRKELKRVYILFNAKHGLNGADRLMLQSLDARFQASGGAGWTLQAVLTKADTMEGTGALSALQKEIFELAPTCLPPVVTSALKHPRLGIEELRRSIAEACALKS